MTDSEKKGCQTTSSPVPSPRRFLPSLPTIRHFENRRGEGTGDEVGVPKRAGCRSFGVPESGSSSGTMNTDAVSFGTHSKFIRSKGDGGGQAIFCYFALVFLPDFSLLSPRTGQKGLALQEG